MKIHLTLQFERDFKKLDDNGKERVYDVISKLPVVIGNPHSHAGIGIRKIHPAGIFEARIGLGSRLIFAIRKNELFLHRIGDHNTIRRYLEGL